MNTIYWHMDATLDSVTRVQIVHMNTALDGVTPVKKSHRP